MFDFDNWKEIGATLARNKTRTFLTAFGIFWGTVMLALLWGGGQGLRGMLWRNFEGFASNSAVAFPGASNMPYKGYQKGNRWGLNTDDVMNIRRGVPELDIVSPMVSVGATIKHKDKTHASQVQGMEPNFTHVMTPEIVEGRFINDYDIAKEEKVTVIGKNVAEKLFPGESPLGKFVEADNMNYRVVGVISQKAADININGRLDDNICIPLSTMRSAYNMGKNIHYLMLVAKDGYSPSELRPQIFQMIRKSHPLHPDDKEALEFLDISDIFEQIGGIFTAVDILLLFVGFSSLIAGVIGVGNIMWIVVKERTKEFGIRRAIGAKPVTIMAQILSESAVLTTIAGLLGICFAVGILALASMGIAQSADIPVDELKFQLTFGTAVIILALFLVLGSAAGLIPALKAMQIKPIEAMNDK